MPFLPAGTVTGRPGVSGPAGRPLPARPGSGARGEREQTGDPRHRRGRADAHRQQPALVTPGRPGGHAFAGAAAPTTPFRASLLRFARSPPPVFSVASQRPPYCLPGGATTWRPAGSDDRAMEPGRYPRRGSRRRGSKRPRWYTRISTGSPRAWARSRSSRTFWTWRRSFAAKCAAAAR